MRIVQAAAAVMVTLAVVSMIGTAHNHAEPPATAQAEVATRQVRG